MAEGENRKKQDIGQDEAYIVNLKQAVENAQDVAGRNRIYFDALALNLVTSMGAINSQIVRSVEQGASTSGKNAENLIGINETDHVAAQILNSPYAEAIKAFVVALTAETAKPKDEA
jgi:hypothetical protein